MTKMSVGLFLNLPNKEMVMRRYMCSYNSPTFLFQPIELLSLAAIYREKKYGEAVLLDAIAEKKSTQDVLKYIKNLSPNFIITLSGFECFEEDVEEIKIIKNMFPDIPIIFFGHYVTQFPEVIMRETDIDYLIHGEPDLIFSELIDVIYSRKKIDGINGVSYRTKEGEVIHKGGMQRIPNPNELPMPAFDLLKNDFYSEPFFPKPYGLMQSARGCPYQCNYCVKSFGTKLTMLTPENMILQVESWIDLFKIKSFRFIDDTFTAVPNRVIEFCKLMIEKGYNNLRWSCLSRPDTLNHEMLQWMKKAGCNRIYVGVESASSEVLNYYNKNFDIDLAMKNLQYLKSLDIELMGFFMVGSPIENKDDVNKSINFAIRAGFEFVVVSKIATYPGTSLYDKMSSDVNFSLLPYKNEFKNSDFVTNGLNLQKYFYRKFYFHPQIIFRIFNSKIRFLFNELWLNIVSFVNYIYNSKVNKSRNDYI